MEAPNQEFLLQEDQEINLMWLRSLISEHRRMIDNIEDNSAPTATARSSSEAPRQQRPQVQPKPFDKRETGCCICQDTIAKDQHYSCLPCQHVLHFQCFKDLFRTGNKKCPICRAITNDDTLQSLNHRPSGTIELPALVERPAAAAASSSSSSSEGLLSRVRNVFSRSETNNTQAPQQRIRGLEEALSEAQRRLTDLEKQKQELMQRLEKQKREYEQFRLLHPELARLESIKKAAEESARRILELDGEISRLMATKLECISDLANRDYEIQRLQQQNTNLQTIINSTNSQRDTLRRRLRDQIDNEHTFRKRLIIGGSAAIGFGGAVLLAYKYTNVSPLVLGTASACTSSILVNCGNWYENNRYQNKLKALE